VLHQGLSCHYHAVEQPAKQGARQGLPQRKGHAYGANNSRHSAQRKLGILCTRASAVLPWAVSCLTCAPLKLLADLNPEQRRAVTTTEGPVLVLAGAGTGKTRVITVRMAYLLSRKVAPESILAMTFTNKAAREMRERVAEIVGRKRAKALFVGTFHSFAIDLLRRYGSLVGLESFTISDSSDQLSILRSALREIHVNNVSIQPAEALSAISLLKSQVGTPAAALEAATEDREILLAKLWERYDEQLRRSRSVDFDDILLYALRILRKRGGPREELRERYRYVMVDEYQDTNGPQYEIVRAVAGGHRNLCVVGDDDQSIYGWRGADISKILGFERDFKGAAVITLETNYRSTKQILEAANRVIRNNPKRHEKTLRSHAGPGPEIRRFLADDESEEAAGVVRDLKGLVFQKKAKLGDFAILFRTGPQARVFEVELRAENINYVLVGGMSFFDRKEIRDVVAYLKILVNPDDEIALLRAINCPPRGIGKASIDRILAYSSEQGIAVSAAFTQARKIPGIPAGTAEACEVFFDNLEGLRHGSGPLVPRIENLLTTVNYKEEVERSYSDPAVRIQRWGAVQEILNFAENHDRRRKGASLETFLQELALEAGDDHTSEDSKKRDVVTLMTLHAAKGLEYPHVYMVGLEEGLLPHTRAVKEDSVDEERRLTYVGITRARRHLTITRTKTRARHGHRSDSMASRFLFELAEQSPPEGWIPAGETQPTKGKKKSKRKTSKRKSSKTPRRPRAPR
jgi:superfamily I DNA/RNA helicase